MVRENTSGVDASGRLRRTRRRSQDDNTRVVIASETNRELEQLSSSRYPREPGSGIVRNVTRSGTGCLHNVVPGTPVDAVSSYPGEVGTVTRCRLWPPCPDVGRLVGPRRAMICPYSLG